MILQKQWFLTTKKKNDRKDFENALLASLENPPYNAKNDLKVCQSPPTCFQFFFLPNLPNLKQKKSANVVAQVLTSPHMKDSDIDNVVGKLKDDQLDLLMKYIYRCLETGEHNSIPLFKWHKSVRDKAGIGSVVRALVERKTVICETKMK